MKRLLILCFALLTSAASARVGETEAELITRFGKPWSKVPHQIASQGKMWDVGPRLNFRQNDWQIAATLVDGRCASISYTKKGDWSEEQVQEVLASNAQGEKWAETSKPSAKKIKRSWKRSDGGSAEWNSHSISITVPAYERAKATVEAKAKAAARQTPKI